MAKLTTKYLGLELKSPVIVSAGPYTQTVESLKKLEAAGAGAGTAPDDGGDALRENHPDGAVPGTAGPEKDLLPLFSRKG